MVELVSKHRDYMMVEDVYLFGIVFAALIDIAVERILPASNYSGVELHTDKQ